MTLLTQFLMFIPLFLVQIANANEESPCGKNVHPVKAYGLERDSSGDIRDGVIAQDEANLKWIALVLSTSTNSRDIPFEVYLKKASAMFFCVSANGPKSGTIVNFDPSDCLSIVNVVGLRLKSQIWTPNSTLSISSIDINRESDAGLLPPAMELDGEKDICFERAEDVQLVTVFGKSTNKEGARANLSIELLVSDPLPTTIHVVGLEHFRVEF